MACHVLRITTGPDAQDPVELAATLRAMIKEQTAQHVKEMAALTAWREFLDKSQEALDRREESCRRREEAVLKNGACERKPSSVPQFSSRLLCDYRVLLYAWFLLCAGRWLTGACSAQLR